VGDVEALVVGDDVEEVERLDLRRGETRHFGEALGVDDLAADVAAGELAVLHAEDRLRIIGRLARRLLLVPTPIERLIEDLEQVAPAAPGLVVGREPALGLAPGPPPPPP